MFGTVAETSTNRTAAPLVFMRDTTTSKVLPRDSFSTWIYHNWVNEREGAENDQDLINKKQLDLG